MGFKIFGPSDPDKSALDFLLANVKHEDVLYVAQHQRIPASDRHLPCRKPGSLKVQALMKDRTVRTVVQDGPGKEPRKTW